MRKPTTTADVLTITLSSTAPLEDAALYQRAIFMAIRSFATCEDPRGADRELLINLADLAEALQPPLD